MCYHNLQSSQTQPDHKYTNINAITYRTYIYRYYVKYVNIMEGFNMQYSQKTNKTTLSQEISCYDNFKNLKPLSLY